MSPGPESFSWVLACALSVGLAWSWQTDLAAAAGDEAGRLFDPASDELGLVESARSRAEESGRRLLLVAGANWCHDSRALAVRLTTPPLDGFIAKHYEVLFLDVGYLDHGMLALRRFGTPIYYATPTVLVIEPSSGVVINEGNRHQWRNASLIGLAEASEYFEEMAVLEHRRDESSLSAQALQRLAEIDAWELEMVARLELAYLRLGPMLRTLDEAGLRPSSFDAQWEEVALFRTLVSLKLDALRTQVWEADEAAMWNTDAKFPVYADFSWESGGN